MAINLMELQPQRISRSLKGKFVFLYGLPGVGKTTLAS
jgi:DNA replication protein DnaC